jgi:hypothetical protein
MYARPSPEISKLLENEIRFSNGINSFRACSESRDKFVWIIDAPIISFPPIEEVCAIPKIF